MTRKPINAARPIKRAKATKAQMAERREGLEAIISGMHPMTVRQVFYQATVQGLIEKTEAGYDRVQTLLADMRRDGDLPYHWIVDLTRRRQAKQTYSSIADALGDAADTYQKSLWEDAAEYVEIWLEKDALVGVVLPVTYKYDVSLMVARGYASLSFLSEAADVLSDKDRPIKIYHLGDFDPSGVNAGEKIEETLNDLAPGADIHFERIAVTPEQVSDWELPTRPTKRSDSRARGFGNISVELDAIDPNRLRALVEEAITRHLSQSDYRALMARQSAERNAIASFVEQWR